MIVSQKCQYALRAVFELTLRKGDGPQKISKIAAAQAIPLPFLQIILNQLKQSGFVDSVRGREGGYVLIEGERKLTIGDVITAVQGPISLVECFVPANAGQCPFENDCVFWEVWDKARQALLEVLNTSTFEDLAAKEHTRLALKNFIYSI